MIQAASSTGRVISVQLGAGEEVCRALCDAVERDGARGAALVAAAGSLRDVSYVLVALGPNGRPRYTDAVRHEGTLELLGLHGHIARTPADETAFHFHGVFGLGDGSVVGGHVLEARVLITIEATLVAAGETGWQTVPYAMHDSAGAAAPQEMHLFVPHALTGATVAP